MLRRLVVLIALVISIALAGSFGTTSSSSHTAAPDPPTAAGSNDSLLSGVAIAAAGEAGRRAQARELWFAAMHNQQVAAWGAAVATFHAQQQQRRVVRVTPRSLSPSPSPTFAVQPPSDLQAVMQCIKNHESGNYTEHSHPSSGSGAYQFIPSTWQHYSTAAGYPGYAYAYLAPPNVQDAVAIYTLRVAPHNWDPAYGNDPCTVNLS